MYVLYTAVQQEERGHKKGKKYQNKIKEEVTNKFLDLEDDITIQNFLDLLKEKGKNEGIEI